MILGRKEHPYCGKYHPLHGIQGLYELECGTSYIVVPLFRVGDPLGVTHHFPVQLVQDEIYGIYFREKKPELRLADPRT